MTNVDMTASRRGVLAGAVGAGALGAGGLSMALPGRAAALNTTDGGSSMFLLEVDGIAGDSLFNGYEGMLDVTSWGFAVAVDEGGGGGRRRARPVPEDFEFVASVSQASPKLYESVVSGRILKEVILHAVTTSGEEPLEYLTITMENVRLVSYQAAGSSGDAPEDVVRAAYERLAQTYQLIDESGQETGQVVSGWDFERNRAWTP